MNLRNSSYYLYGDQDMSKAFVQGFLAAMRVYKHAVPVAGNAGEIAAWVAATAVANDVEGDRQHRARVRKILENGIYSPFDFRAMLLDCAMVDEYGREINSEGSPIVSLAEHRPWLNVFYTDDYSGDITALTKPNKPCREVRYLDVLGDDGMNLFQIRTDDSIAIEEALKLDIAFGDPINKLYLEKCQEGGILEEYVITIHNAIKKR